MGFLVVWGVLLSRYDFSSFLDSPVALPFFVVSPVALPSLAHFGEERVGMGENLFVDYLLFVVSPVALPSLAYFGVKRDYLKSGMNNFYQGQQ